MSLQPSPGTAALSGHRVIVFLQENKTTDFYFRSLAGWGAAVADLGAPLAAPPDFDQPHDRNAWVHYRMRDYPALPVQIDTDAVIPLYAWLAKTFTFCDHHFGLGSNSTSGHMLAVGGQSPTLKNPPFTGTHPVWNLPSIFSLAQAAGVSWAAFPDQDGYPTKFYASLTGPPGNEDVLPPSQFIPMARGGTLPQICYVWSPSGYDEHPPSSPRPSYISDGHNLVWQRIQAVIDGGGWTNTTFILTWDDWGGYADSIPTPNTETALDAVHPDGFQIIGGSRIPLIMFGGKVAQGIDARWHSHATIPKTIIDLLGLPPIGIARVDAAPSLADRIDPSLDRPAPPAYGSSITQPAPPTPAPAPADPGPWPGPSAQPLSDLITIDGSTIPAPADATVYPKPPKSPTIPPGTGPGSGPGSGTGTGTGTGTGSSDLSGLVDKKYADQAPAQLLDAPLEALHGLSPAKADLLHQALGITTIGQLAAHRFIRAAQDIAASTDD